MAREMRFWGWGSSGSAPALPDGAVALLHEELEIDGRIRVPVDLAEVRLPPALLDDGTSARLRDIVGEGGVQTDRTARVLHAAGRSYPDLVALRAGGLAHAPDAVVAPADARQLLPILEACANAGVAVVPFGGGTSVVGGVTPLRGTHRAVVSLDLARLDDVLAIDERSLLVTVQPGLRLPDLDARLAARGLTLAHTPQSYEFASIGGCVATRSAGQASTGFGRIDALVRGVRLVAPTGELALSAVPASAAGPDLRQLIVGSEGTLGVISAATLRVLPAPRARRYEGFAFRSFAEGIDTLRLLTQAGTPPDIARLSDETETRLNLALSRTGAALRRALGHYLGARGAPAPCMLIAGWEGTPEDVARRRRRTVALLRRAGAIALGAAPGRAWEHGRFAGPYLRDDLLARGVLVDTFETATTWSSLFGLYHGIRDAVATSLAGRGTPPQIMCHVSHLYRDGASLYFTVLARQDDDEPMAQWRAMKTAAGDAIAEHGGTISHHHAVGTDHAAWMEHEVGAQGLDLLRAAKQQLDPAGIMNPGKLLPASS